MAIKVLQLSSIDLTIYSFLMPLMQRLQSEGYEVCFACRDMGKFESIEQEGFRGFPISIRRNLNPISAILTVVQLYKLLKKENIDIIHVHTPVASVLGRFAAMLAGTRIKIYTVHGFYVSNPIFYYLEKLFARHMTDHIFTVSQEDYDYAVSEGFISKERISYINSVGIDTTIYCPDAAGTDKRNELRACFGIGNEDTVVGFIGRLVKEKGIIDLFKAFNKIADRYPHLKLMIIGSQDAGERDTSTKGQLDKLIHTAGISDRVIFTGFREDIPELLRIMDIFVLPSYREGMPVALLEAMSSGLPVIATDIRGCREEVDATSGLLYKPGDIEELAAAIEVLINNPQKALQLGKNARTRVIELFDQEISISKQIEVYKSLSQ